MTRATLAALLSHWWRHPVQLMTLLLGLALATALWSGVQAINAEARASYGETARVVGGSEVAALITRDGQAVPLETYLRLRRAGWLVAPVVEGTIPTVGGSVGLIGLDFLTAPPPALVGDDAIAADVNPADAIGLLFADAATAGGLEGRDDLPAIVIADGLPAGIVLADIGVVTRLLGDDWGIDRLMVLPEQPRGRSPLSEIAPELERREAGRGDEIARLTDSFHLNLTAFGFLSFAVGLFIVHGAVGLAFEQRRATFRTLRALGLPAGRLIALLGAELLTMAIFAGLVGTVLGGLVAAGLLPDVAATLRGLYGATLDGSLTLRPAWWAAGMGITVAGTALAGAGALWKVAHLPLLAPAQPRAWARASERTLRLLAGAATALVALAMALAILGSGLVVGFVMLGALLVASALTLPLWLSLWLRVGERLARGPLTEWFWADTRQQLPGLNLALMALLLALAANIGVGTMVKSFRLTFTGWLDQRLASELYVEVADEEQGRALVRWLETRAATVLPIRHAEATVLGVSTSIYGVADHPTYRDNWPMLSALPDAWDSVAQGDGVLVNEQLARRERLIPGDRIPLPDRDARVVGIYSDYGNPTGQVLVGLPRIEAFGDVEKLDYGIRTEDPVGLARALIGEFGLAPNGLVDQASLKRRSLEVFERTFAVTSALNILTLGIAGLAILTSLLTLAGLRLPQVAPVWAMGLTRTHLARIELLRSLILAALTFVAAVPVGLLLAWVLLAVINVEAFGWQLPMYVFPGDWLLLGALSLFAAAIASLWPARRLATRPPADLVKVFASEH